jgi:starch phosphorylase
VILLDCFCIGKNKPIALTIGFGRRFATYKRAHLLFTDLERLSKIVNNPNYPVRLFHRKSSPCRWWRTRFDKKNCRNISYAEFLGKVFFLKIMICVWLSV